MIFWTCVIIVVVNGNVLSAKFYERKNIPQNLLTRRRSEGRHIACIMYKEYQLFPKKIDFVEKFGE